MRRIKNLKLTVGIVVVLTLAVVISVTLLRSVI